MPIRNCNYKAPVWIGGKHSQTILPSLFREVNGIDYLRERISTPDGDFLDLDWSRVGSKKLIICSHGLEGSSRQHYVRGMVKEFNAIGWDAVGWNLRGCSGEPNHTIKIYDAGCVPDLAEVVNHAVATKRYKEICLIGYSLGGNLTLKYLGDYRDHLPKEIKRGCVFSTPCDLYACARNLSHGINRIYLNRFMVTLKEKVGQKAKIQPGLFSSIDLKKIHDFIDFDNYITAPLGGYKDAVHYYMTCSSKFVIGKIEVPTLIVNALNDPFLHPSCFPREECSRSKTVTFESPYDGGHLGFTKNSISGTYWSEERAMEFFEEGK